MGRKQFDNQTIIRAVPSRKVAFLQGSDTTSLAVGATAHMTVYAPPNTTARVRALAAIWLGVTGATSGTKRLAINQSGVTNIGLARIEHPYNVLNGFDQGGALSGYSLIQPNDLAALTGAVFQGAFDETNGFDFAFTNLTDVASVDQRAYYLYVEEEAVA